MTPNQEYLAEILQKLKRTIPHHWRVQSFSKTKPFATVMAYIDARNCMDILDEVCVYGWHREHYLIENKVYCRVGIVMPDSSIMWRSDCGVESSADKEKGQSSDSFKRACVNFGIGRFLYDLPIQRIATNIKKEKDNYPYCIDENGKQIYDLTKFINNKTTQPAPKPQETKEPLPLTFPQETLDSIKESTSREQLLKIWDDCTSLQANQQFKMAYLTKWNELPKMKKEQA